ncbi:MAG: TRAP transporter substrate-binding protein DctP [Pseudooceanicola sp.]|nr:TRAP transporter substrate-binding protein DctP [Pseudooceanicola sp.]
MKLLKAGLLSALLLGAQQVAADTKIVFNNFLSPNDALWTDVMLPWIADIERVTEGRVTFTVPASSLAPPPELFNAVQQGVADGAFQMVGFLRQSNPEMQMPLLPMTYFGNRETSVAFWRTYEKFFAGKNDMKDVVLLGLITTPPASFFNMKPEPIQSLADLQGLKIWSLPGVTADALSALGAVVTPGPAVRMYEVISGGVVDAFCCINFESLEVFNVSQYLGSATEVPGHLFAPAFAVFLHKDVWATISPEDQQAIREVSGETLAQRGAFGDPKEAEARQRAIDRGIPVVPASDAFVAEITAALEPIRGQWYDAVGALGIDGKAALEFYLAEQAKIKAGN